MRVIVTGAAGQLGQAVVERFSKEHEVTALSRQALDLTRHEHVVRVIGEAHPHAVVNCAAYNAVDQAEDDVLAALEANAFAVRSLARACEQAGAVLVHYSTDFVFDGDAHEPYTEDDSPGPTSVYGQSKLLGEWLARDAQRWYVLRVESLFGGPRPKSSIDRIIDALRSGSEARVFTDRVVTPSYVDDVAAATTAILRRDVPVGLYHCVNDGQTTWHDLAVEIARQLQIAPRLVPVRVAEVAMRAPRPTFCALSNRKLAAAGVPMPPWQDAIRRHLQRRAG